MKSENNSNGIKEEAQESNDSNGLPDTKNKEVIYNLLYVNLIKICNLYFFKQIN